MIVADLLAEHALQLRLHTPSSRTRLGRRISWCAPAEATDPTPFLGGNVLVLTNGAGIAAEDEHAWHAYAERLAGVPVSAIAFGTGAAHGLLPGGLVKAATVLDVPLLELPRAVSFLQVHRHVANVLQAERQAARARSRELAEACSRHAASGSPVRRILGEIGKAAGAPVAIVDADGSVIAQWPAAPGRPAGDPVRAARDEEDHSVPVPDGGAGAFRLVVRGAAPGEPLATLLAPAAAVLAVQLNGALHATSHRQAQLLTLLAQAADWQHVALQEFARTFRSTGLEAGEPTVIAAAALAEGGPAGVWKVRLLLQEAFGELRIAVRGGIAYALAQRPAAGFFQDPGEAPAAVLARLIRAAAPHQGVVLKGPCGSMDELRLGLCEAAQLVRQAAAPVAAPDFGIGSLLAAAAGHGARAGADRLLAPVQAYDAEHSADLVRTLRVYLDRNCQPSLACADLFIHRNTLAQRLRKLEALLNLDLDTLEGRATCLLALRLCGS